ncbi:MAG: NAD(P)H-dependent glycerol-3-phosphate dehydrogenase [Thermodesulfovibrionales bacterium]
MKYPNGYISIIGAGAWGTTLAILLGNKGYDVTIWGHEQDVVDSINSTGTNHVYLPDITIPHYIHATTDIEEAVKNARYIINVVPTQFIRDIFTKACPFINDYAYIVSASKGIEKGTHLLPSMILEEILDKPVSVLSGPSFAIEVARQYPTAVTLGVRDRKVGLIIQELFNTDYFRVYTHDDIVGIEIGGAMKNVIAIASGICAGLQLGNNARAALITRGLSEITRLGLSMGAKPNTFSGLSGLGDLLLTCTAMMSRNYTVGYRLGKGESLKEIVSSTRSVAEGVTTTLSAYELANIHKIEMPITEQVYYTLYQDKPPTNALKDLMARSLKAEFDAY